MGREFARPPKQHAIGPRAAFAAAVAEKPAGRFMIRSRIRVVKRHPEGDLVSGGFLAPTSLPEAVIAHRVRPLI